MATPTYNIPGQTSALGAGGPAARSGSAAADIAADTGEPLPRTVAAVLARGHAGDVLDEFDRARLRQASRLFADRNREFTPEDLTTLAESDIRASRVFEFATHASGQPGGKE